jgi:predicted DNA-binding protein (MmcQ/YjbR family)
MLETAMALTACRARTPAAANRSWVNLPWGTSEAELRYRLTASYRLVRASLTKKAQAQLDPFE